MYNRFRDHLRKKDRGSVLLEAIASLAIISFLTLGYTATATSATLTQRTAVNDSIATQVTQGVFETARATQWSMIGTKTKPAAGLLPASAGEVFETSDAFPATTTKTVRGLKVTVRTAVGWQDKPGAGSDFGTKMIVVDVAWRDNEADATSANSRRESTIITPGIGESAPSGVRAADEAAVPDPPAAPTLSATVLPEGPKIRATWNQVPNATGYSVEYRENGGTWGTRTTYNQIGTMLIDAKHGDTVQLKMRAQSPAGPSAYSNTVTVVVPPALGAPVVTGAETVNSDGFFTWPAIPSATTYSVEKRINGGAWVADSTQSYPSVTVSGTPGIRLEVRVRANVLGASGPWSAVARLDMIPLPDAPVVIGVANSPTQAYFFWPSVASADVQYQIDNGPWTKYNAWFNSAFIDAPAGSTVRVSVKLAGRVGWSLPGLATVKLPTTPEVPVVTGTLYNMSKRADFSWPDVSFATSYRVEYRYGTGAWTLLEAANTTRRVTVPMQGDAQVTARVRATNSIGSSAWAQATAKIQIFLPMGANAAGGYQQYPAAGESLSAGRVRQTAQGGTTTWSQVDGKAARS